MKLGLKVVPASSRRGIAGRLGDLVKVKVTEPAQNGRANTAVLSTLAEALDVPKSDLKMIAGSRNSRKIVEISSLTESEVYARLSKYGV